MNRLFLGLLLIIATNCFAQSNAWKSLGLAEKTWVLLHPFSVGEATCIYKHVLTKMDSLRENQVITNSGSGSKLDALRHAYWMALMSNRIGAKRALWLGKAHEKKNVRDFKKKRVEEGNIPDSKAIEMDLKNNQFGVKIGKHCKNCSNQKLLVTSLEALNKGELFIIKQNRKGDFLDDTDRPIPQKEWQGKWENKRVLVPSNYKL